MSKLFSKFIEDFNLGALRDVNLGAPSNNQTLRYNSTTQKWGPAANGAATAGVKRILDADFTLASGDFLILKILILEVIVQILKAIW